MHGTRHIRLLEAEPDLRATLTAIEYETARQIRAPARRLAPGEWAQSWEAPPRAHLGFLVTEGLVARRLTSSKGIALELLARGDVLRPWQEEAASFDEGRWRILEAAVLAELTPAVTSQVCAHPALVAALMGRIMRRCRSLLATAAIHSIPGLGTRLLALFWHLAEDRGRRGPDGVVVVPLSLTHSALAEMVGARRPSVTSALTRLAEEGMLTRVEEGWLLRGDPPTLEDEKMPTPPSGGVGNRDFRSEGAEGVTGPGGPQARRARTGSGA